MELFLRRQCLVPWLDSSVEKARACLLGIGYDSSSVEQSGQRNAPKAVRERLSAMYGHDLESGRNVFDGIADLGDLEVAHGSSRETSKRLGEVLSRLGEKNPGIVPVMIGGEHTITLFASRALAGKGDSLLVFDAHLDLFQGFEGELTHMSFLRRACEEKLYDRIVIVGARACAEEEIAFLKSTGQKIEVFFIQEVEEKGLERTRKEIGKELGKDRVYCSIDIDVLDSLYAMGCGSPESSGFTPKELKYLLGCLEGRNVLGVDLVEVNPLLDHIGVTCFHAADLVKKVFSLV